MIYLRVFCTGLSKKISARFCELTVITELGASLNNLTNNFFGHPCIEARQYVARPTNL